MSKQRLEKKKFETVQNYEFQTQKGKNKYNMFEWRIKNSQHLKNPILQKIWSKP